MYVQVRGRKEGHQDQASTLVPPGKLLLWEPEGWFESSRPHRSIVCRSHGAAPSIHDSLQGSFLNRIRVSNQQALCRQAGQSLDGSSSLVARARVLADVGRHPSSLVAPGEAPGPAPSPVVERRRGDHQVGSDERAGGAMKQHRLVEEPAAPERYDIELAQGATEPIVVDIELQLEIAIPTHRRLRPDERAAG